jgi:hypothetical protein
MFDWRVEMLRGERDSTDADALVRADARWLLGLTDSDDPRHYRDDGDEDDARRLAAFNGSRTARWSSKSTTR